MPVTRILLWMLVLGITTCVGQTANAQRFQPFVEPGYFDHDFQMFAPAELGKFGGKSRPKVGWFGSIGRTHMYVSRPDRAVTPDRSFLNQTPFPAGVTSALDSAGHGDFTWGYRIDLGYMTDEDHGWLFAWSRIDGPNAFDELYQERIERQNPDDLPDTGTDTGTGTGTDDNMDFILLQDQNTFIRGIPERVYLLKDSVNHADMHSLEINKIFRRPTLHNGGILEPFFGFRFIKFTDYSRTDSYDQFQADGNPLDPVPVPGSPVVEDLAVIEQMVKQSARFDNYMYGGQVGGRYNIWKGRWNLSTEVRAFAMHNHQVFEFVQDTEVYETATPMAHYLTDRRRDVLDEFVIGAEVRAAAAFEVTRDFAFQVGFEFMNLNRGIGRGFDTNYNDQDVVMAGLFLGGYVRR